MKKIALLFSGQGSQYVEMGKSLEDQYKMYFTLANSVLGYDLKKIIDEGPEEDLALTQNTQPAILSYSIALFNKLTPLLQKYNQNIDLVMGHSVGEYAALVAAGVLTFKDAVKAVHLRGQYMQESVPVGVGAMIALLKVPENIVTKCCQEVSTDEHKVMPANFNEPGQIVISGHKEACDKALAWLETNFKQPYRSIPLKVSAPFHSTLMEPAAAKLATHFENISFEPTQTRYIANIDAKEYTRGTSGDIVKQNLIKQVAGSVLWTQSFSKISNDTLCLEVGPGKTLMGLGRKINRNIKVISLDKEESFDEVTAYLES